MSAIPQCRSRRAVATVVCAALAAGLAAMPAVPAEAASRSAKRLSPTRLLQQVQFAGPETPLDARRMVREPKVVGGIPASDQAFASIAAMITHDRVAGGDTMLERHFCGGSLIHPRIVLTAAHCLYYPKTTIRRPADRMQVLLGRRNLNSTGGEKIDVAAAVHHPSYRPQGNTVDVAVLVLAQPATTPVGKLMDPAMPLRAGDPTLLMGWGATSEGGSGSAELLAVGLPIVGWQACKAVYSDLDDTMICAGAEGGGKDSCQGDSGGPIAVRDATGSWAQIGIVSFGTGCARPRTPGVYSYLASGAVRGFVEAALRSVSNLPTPQPQPQPQPQPEPQVPAGDTVAPLLRMTMTPAAVSMGELVTARFDLDESATIKIAVLRHARVGGRTRLVRLPGLIERRANGGLSELRLRPRRVKRGATYLLAIQATDAAGNRSPILGARFRVR